MISHIFKYEWLSLIKNRLFLTVFGFTLVLSGLALWSGTSTYRKQVRQLDQIRQYESAYYQDLGQKLKEIEQNGFKGNSHSDPSKPTTLAVSKGFRYVYREPFFLQVLNTGQSDLHPYYYKVTASKQQALYHSGEIKNGAMTFVGNYDFSFVFIFLLPLLIIAFSFDMYAKEKAEGTLPYLSQGKWSVGAVLLSRYLFRALLFFGTLWILSVLVLAGLFGLEFLGFTQFWLWSLVLLGYISFWFMLSFAVNSQGKNANYNAAALVFAWLFSAVLLPGLLQFVTDKLYPVPARADLITLTREAGVEVQKKAANLMEDYIQDHPELAANKEGLNLQDFGTRYFVQLEEVEKAVEPVVATFEAKQKTHDAFVRYFSVLSPAVLTQELINELSATSNRHFRSFAKDTEAMQQELREVFVKKIFIGKPFSAEELAALPDFEPKESYYLVEYAWFWIGLSVLFGCTAGFTFFGYRHLAVRSTVLFDVKTSV